MDLALLFSASAFVVSLVALVVALYVRRRAAVRVVYLRRDVSVAEIKTPSWRYVRYIYETPGGVFTMESMEEFARRRV